MRKEAIRPWMIGVAALLLLAGIGAAVPSIRASYIDTNVVGTLTVNGAIIPNVAGTQSVGMRAIPYSEIDANFVYLQAGGGVQSNPTAPGTLHLGDVTSTSMVANQAGNVFTMNGIFQAGSGTGNLDWSPSSGLFKLPTGGMPAGTGTAVGLPGLALYRDTTATPSVTTGETFGSTYTLPANTWGLGQEIRIKCAFQKAANANAVTAKVYVNGTALITMSNSTSGDAYSADLRLVRVGGTAASYSASTIVTNTGGVVRGTAVIAPASTQTIQISVTGATTNGDLSTTYMRVEWMP